MDEYANMIGFEPGTRYQHFKGGLYTVVTLARLEATGEPLVIYKHVETGTVWARPLSVFTEQLPDGQPRFRRVAVPNVLHYDIPVEDESGDQHV